MRKGLVYLMAVSVCLALAFTPLMADRTDRTADRTKGADRNAGTSTDWSATFGDMFNRLNNGPRDASGLNTNAAKASELVAAAAASQTPVALLTQVASMDLPQNAETEKVLSEVYNLLAGLYEGTPSKQVHWYSLAMQYTADPAARADLESRITSLGGDAFAVAYTQRPNTASTREDGYDTCEDAMAVTLPYTTNMSIVFWGDHDWFSFDLAGPDGYYLSIGTDHPSIYTDTDLELWDGCPGTMVASDDDGGPGFLSLIETGCTAPGTYYVAVGGWLDFATPQDFDFWIAVTGTCVMPTPDSYEPDDDRADASDIGHPTSIPLHANGWGRVKKEIQDRNIFPAGNEDTIAFAIERNEIVSMETAGQIPTFFNDFVGTVGYYDNPDTYMELLYGIEPDYGGWCNNTVAGFIYDCYSEADCEGFVEEPMEIWPDCIPVQSFTVSGAPYWFDENPLAFNDDGGEGFSSFIQACIPRGDQQTTSASAAGDWLVRVWPYSASMSFDYQLMVRNETPCDFEFEPNNDFAYATPMVWGLISGIMDQNLGGAGNADIDLYQFDVPENLLVSFETWGPDAYQSDTGLELYVGPDDYGYYYYTGVSNDDCYAWLSCLDVILPPASDLLGNMYVDADYFLNVTTFWLNKNFLYSLFSWTSVAPSVVYEAEPNDTCPGNAVALDDTVYGAIDDFYLIGEVCDYDNFTFTVTADTFVTMETDGGIDSTIAVYDGSGTYIGCDDDGGYSVGSMLFGCLPPDDYCVTVRGYGYWTFGDYELFIGDGGTCAATTPVYLGENGLRCDGGSLEFETCPN